MTVFSSLVQELKVIIEKIAIVDKMILILTYFLNLWFKYSISYSFDFQFTRFTFYFISVSIFTFSDFGWSVRL
jgi:hypothetical protein